MLVHVTAVSLGGFLAWAGALALAVGLAWLIIVLIAHGDIGPGGFEL
jgi:hypothetical protein